VSKIVKVRFNLLLLFTEDCIGRGGSRILQGRVSNPSERGTGGRAPKAPREVGSGEGAVPPPPKIFVFLISKW